MNKILIGAVGIALLITAVGWFSYNAGINSEKARDAAAIAKYQKKISGLLGDLEEEKAKQKVVTREKIITVKTAQDASQCADTAIPDAIYNQL